LSDRPTPANRLNPSTAPVPPDLLQLGRSLALERAITTVATIAQANAVPTRLCYHFLGFEAETLAPYGLDPVATSTRTIAPAYRRGGQQRLERKDGGSWGRAIDWAIAVLGQWG
jgi:hypothetical protein